MKEIKLRYLGRKWVAAALAGTMMLSMIPGAAAAEISSGVEGLMETVEPFSAPEYVQADWKFGKEGVKSGTIAGGDLMIADQSGKGNDLEMQLYVNSQLTEDKNAADWENYLEFSEDSMTGEGGSMVFNGDDGTVDKWERKGADFITVDEAPINEEEFTGGYTLEYLYYFPEDWTAADEWMSLMARQSDASSGIEEWQQGSMYTSISNCKEIQFVTGNAAGNYDMPAAWSVSMDEGGVWYHIAVVSDGKEIAAYVNGCEAFRNCVSDKTVGIYADPNDGRFRVGSSWWKEGNQTLDKFLQGSLQEIRISDKALDKNEWLVPNPEDYVGEFGSNETYELRDEDNYNIVLLPDTQNTVEFRPDVMNAAIDGLIDSADELNVAGVIHLGDVVDDNLESQYASARDAFYRLPQAGIKTLMQKGNHDGDNNYRDSFSGKSETWTALTSDYLNWSPNGNGDSSYMFVQAGSYNYLVISLSAAGNGKTDLQMQDAEWLRSVLEEYPDCPTIVTTHDLQNCSDTQPSAIKLSPQGSQLWNIVKSYDQVFMLVGGHSHGSGMEVLKNDHGREVVSILTDLQFAYNGGNGWFRYLEFDESADKIYYSTYSPYAAGLDESEKTFFDVNFLTGAGNEGEIDFDFDQRFVDMETAPAQTEGYANGSADLDVAKIAGYKAGQANVDGGVMEIVAYNPVNQYAYAVNGATGKLAVIPMADLKDTGVVSKLSGDEFDVKAVVEQADDTFTYGDMTSVAVSPDGATLAVALQAEGYADAGRAALFTCAEDGSLILKGVVTVGVQPDMITFADNSTALTADEGEPRMGYGETTVDPKGSITVIDAANLRAETVTFDSFDAKRDELVQAGVVLKKDANPSEDLEPEYIAVAGGKAYATLQEANAVAVLDIKTKTIEGVYSCGFEDYSRTPVDIDKKDGQYAPKTYDSLMGIRMPDSIAAYTAGGKTYLLTANEGDSREWGDYSNEDERNFGKDKTSPTGAITKENSGLTGKVVFFDSSDYDGVNTEKDYLFGGRTFTIFQVTGNGLKEVFTSGSGFEKKTAQYVPEYFNASNDNATMDDRSGKKGPEPEGLTVGQIQGRTYAFVALERTGGIMIYDVTNPGSAAFVNYINSRNFETIVPGSEEYDDGELDKWVTGGDVAPEGLAFLTASQSPTGKPILLAACEVSGTVAAYELTYQRTSGGGSSSGSGSSSGGKDPVTPVTPEKLPFTDVADNAWYHDAVEYVYDKGVMSGVSADAFAPNQKLSRAMVAQILYGLEGKPASGEQTFTDVKDGQWFAKAVNWAAKEGLVSGYGDGTFGPDDNVTREQLAAILRGYAKYKGGDAAQGSLVVNGFRDGESISAWALEAMNWAVNVQLMTGKGGNTLDPQGNATRAEVAQMLMNFLEKVG